MRQLMTGLAWLVLAVGAGAQGDFTATLSEQDRAAAGLNKLTPAELARLKALVERYKSGEVAVVQQQAEQKVAAVRAEGERAVADVQAEAKIKVAAAEARAERDVGLASDDAKQPGWLRALVTLQRVGGKPEAQEALESKLATEFRGWRSNTVFTLENGQRWRVDGTDEYVARPQPAPRVRIKPGALGAYWMEIEGVRPRVKVKPAQL